MVVREKWSDWSLFAVPSSVDAVEVIVTIEMERLGDVLMIYKILGAERERTRSGSAMVLFGRGNGRDCLDRSLRSEAGSLRRGTRQEFSSTF